MYGGSEDYGPETTAFALRNYARLLGNWRFLRMMRQPSAVGDRNLAPTLRSDLDHALVGLEVHAGVDVADRFQGRHDEMLERVREADRYPLETKTPVPCEDPDWVRRIGLDLEIAGQGGPCERQEAFALQLAEKLEFLEGTRKATEKAKPRKRGKGGRPRDSDPQQDAKIYEGWKSGAWYSFADYARELGMKEKDVSRAVDRHRKRIRPARRKNPPVK